MRLPALLACLTLGSVKAGPCDIFLSGGTPCVAAHGFTRALYSSYDGPLYQVLRTSDNTTLDIKTLAPGGVQDAAAQDEFCAHTDCIVTLIYDQSPKSNHLSIAPAGGHVKHGDQPINATRFKTTLGGKEVYSGWFDGGQGYRNDVTTGVATGNEEETLYMVTSGIHYNAFCCFDFGNMEVDNNDDGKATMEAIYFGSSAEWGHGAGKGPWVLADLEQGLWPGGEKVNLNNTPLPFPFVTAMVKGGSNGFGLKGGDATAGPLKTMYDGPRPAGYQPMKKKGAIALGIGGDNSNGAIGTFMEGCITAGLSSDATDALVQQDIISALYGQ